MNLLLATLLLAAQPSAQNDNTPRISGYQEVIISVADLEGWRDFLVEVGGWSVRHAGTVARERLDFLSLGEAWSAEEILLGNADQARGWIRLIRFDGGPQVQVRSNAQAWDTGGWFDFNVRTLDLDRKFAEMQARGWQAPTDPVTFEFGRFEVKEWLARGPDGVVIALIERIRPTLEGWDDLEHFSRAFNATQIVSDFDAALRFYREVLGFEIYLEHEGPSREPGPNVLGLPHNLAAEVPRRVAILHPDGVNEGSVEILSFEGVTGTDFSDRARAPNLGILALAFPVDDVHRLTEVLRARGATILREPTDLDVPGLGSVAAITVVGPDGAHLDFYASRERR
ncbi:MAG: VOC family protein [Pseudomonadota bacterium]